MALDLGGLLQKYLNVPAGQSAADAEDHFDQVAQHASPEVVGQGISDALRSDQTPSLGQMVSQVFSKANPQQQAGMLNQILGSLESRRAVVARRRGAWRLARAIDRRRHAAGDPAAGVADLAAAGAGPRQPRRAAQLRASSTSSATSMRSIRSSSRRSAARR